MFIAQVNTTASLGRIAPVPDERADGDEAETALAYYAAIPLAAVAFVTVMAVFLCMRRRNFRVNEHRAAIEPERQYADRNIQGQRNIAFSPQEATSHELSFSTTRTQSLSSRMTEKLPAGISARERIPPFSPQSDQKIRPIGMAAPIQLPIARIRPMNSSAATEDDSPHTVAQAPENSSSLTADAVKKRAAYPTTVPSIATSLDASPVFQRLKYDSHRKRRERAVSGTPSKLTDDGVFEVNEKTWKRHSLHTKEIQLSKFKTLKTDFNPSPNASEVSLPNYMKSFTLDRERTRTGRRAHRDREAETEWAIEHHLTSERPRHTKRLSPKPSKKEPDGSKLHSSLLATPIGDLPKELQQDVRTSSPTTGSSFRRKSKTLVAPPYKLQAKKCSIRPNREVDKFGRKRPSSIISKSIRRRSKRFSRGFEFNVVEYPSFYTGFDTPLPPAPQSVGLDSEFPQKSAEGRQQHKPVSKPNSTTSDHDYEEITSLNYSK